MDDPASPWLGLWNVKVHAVGKGKLKYGFTTALDRWLAANLAQFDVAIVQGIWMYFGYAVWRTTRRVAVPYFLFIHGALDPWFKRHYPLKHFKKTIYWKAFEHKGSARRRKGAVYDSGRDGSGGHASLPYQCRAEMSGYGIARPELPNHFDKTRSIAEITAAHPALGNRNFALFLARVHEKKGNRPSVEGVVRRPAGAPGHGACHCRPGRRKDARQTA